ncbi:MAG TPA: hypothetical protein VE869_07205 [Gemmatimonas sp.]|nr:hypothetical protein [Gemmatimonas sp.]
MFPLALSACWGDRESAGGGAGDSAGSSASNDSKGEIKVSFPDDSLRMPPLGEGDVMITSTDGAFVMAAIGDTVRMQLSDSLRMKVAQDINASAGDKGGIGASIARTVSKAVAGAMGFSVRIPVESIENLRFENGQMRFEVRGANTKVFGSKDTGSEALFRPADALRFISVVEQRQRGKIAQ